MKTNREIAHENGLRFGIGIRDGNKRTARAHGTVSGRRLKDESPGEEEAKQDEDMHEPLLSVVASDDEDKDIERRSEDGHGSWSVVDGLRAPSLAATWAVLIQGPVTYLRERDQPRYQPPREGLREAQVTAERPGDG